MQISIVIPCFNDINTIDELIRRVLAVDLGVERQIVIVDDCSVDGTREYLSKLDHPEIRVLFHDVNKGKGAALRTGFMQVTGDIVIIQDADLECDPGDYPRLLKPILEGKADVVYGSRFIGTDAHLVPSFWHSRGNQLLTLYSNIFTNLNLTDMEACYKVFKSSILDRIRLREDRFGFDSEFTAKVAKLDCVIYEVGISYSAQTRAEGKKINWKDGARAFYVILKYSLWPDKIQPQNSSASVRQTRPGVESLVWALMILASLMLLALSVYRAATYSFTVDESVDFGILHWNQRYSQMGNLSQPYVMELSARLFGTSELSLRLPTLFGHALYLVCGLLLLKRIRSVLLRLSGFVLLNLNPFLLDFMFLARGYGLALGCLMLSALLLTLAYEHREKSRFLPYLFLSVLAGCLSVVANLSFLNFIVPLLLATAWILFTDATLRRIDFRHILPAAGIYAVAGGFLALVLMKAFDLQTRGALSYGGHTGFLNDTYGSLFSSSRYFVSYSPQMNTAVLLTVFGLFGAICLICVWMLIKRPKVPIAVLYSVLLIGALALPILENTLLGVLYPLDRAVLYFVPLFALALIASFDLVAQASSPAWMRGMAVGAPSLVAVALLFHFSRSYDPQVIYSWQFNAHDKQVIELINQDRQNAPSDRPLKLGNTWLYEPSMNFYRFTRGFTWLEPVTRDPINGKDFDYIYASESDLAKTPIPNAVILAQYPDTNTTLLRVNRESP